MAETTAIKLELKHISKSFPGVKALEQRELPAPPRYDPCIMRRKRGGEIHPDENHQRDLQRKTKAIFSWTAERSKSAIRCMRGTWGSR